MALTTPVSNSDAASMMKAAILAKVSQEEKFATLRSIFAQHLIEHDELNLAILPWGETYATQRKLTDQINGFIIAQQNPMTINLSGSANQEEGKHIGVLGVVDFYDSTKGFGFVDIQELGERCYVGSDALKVSNVDTINDGDDILCDVGPSPKGPQITLIHDIQYHPNEIELLECIIVKLVTAKNFGFVSVASKSEDALFHFSLLQEADIPQIAVGKRFLGEVRTNSKNDLQQVRRIEKFIDD